MANESWDTTHFSMLNDAVQADDVVRREALARLMHSYAPALTEVVARHFSVSMREAEALMHDFVQDKVVAGKLIEKYLQKQDRKGFRAYLKVSLRRFVLDELGRSKRRLRVEEIVARPEVFDREVEYSLSTTWVREVVSNVLRKTRRHYLKSKRADHWHIFVRRFIQPVLCQGSPPSYEELAVEFGLQNPKQVCNVVTTVLRRVQKDWHEVLAKDIGSDDPRRIRAELADIRGPLAYAVGTPDLLTQLPSTIFGDASELNSADGTQLSQLLDVVTNRRVTFTDVELEVLYLHYLTVPLSDFFRQSGSKPPAEFSSTIGAGPGSAGNIRELVRHPHPPVELLIHLKKVFSRMVREEDPVVPRDLSIVFRFLIIALAWVKAQHMISKLPRDRILDGIRLITRRAWLDRESQSLLEVFATSLEDSASRGEVGDP